MLALALAASLALPPVIADPRRGPSDFALAGGGGAARPAGVLVPLPDDPTAVDQRFLETLVAWSARGVPVLSLGGVPPASLLPYLDGAVLEPAPPLAALPDLRRELGSLPLFLPAADAAGAVSALAAGAAGVVMPAPPAIWREELRGLVEETRPAVVGGEPLATALRTADLATVVGLPPGFAGGEITLPSDWYGSARLVRQEMVELPVVHRAGSARVVVPAVPEGGLVIVQRPGSGGGPVELVEVAGTRLPSAAEVLARHQRAVARQERTVRRWRAVQRLLVRVYVADLGRSVEVVLEGPAFHTAGVGTDWEIARAWVDGVPWDADELPDLPLLEPERPPVPPLALRLEPSWTYELAGTAQRGGRQCFALAFRATAADGTTRQGTAFIDSESFALVELEEQAENLPGEVRATRSVSSLAPVTVAGETAWLPRQVVADDLLAVFGGSATVHRQLTLAELVVEPEDFAAQRAAAYARPHRMLRDAPSGLAPLLPDGQGGRRVGGGEGASHTFLVAGLVWDPGLDFPVPFGGLQIQDFDFRGRGEHLRAFIAGVVNDAAWSRRRGAVELTARGFAQLYPFSSSVWVRGVEQEGEAVKVMRQRVGLGVARTVGATRVLVEAGVARWDFRRTDETAAAFVLPRDTFEGGVLVETQTVLGATTLTLAGEGGWRNRWEVWGMGAANPPERRWRRGRIGVVRESTPLPLTKLTWHGEFIAGSHLDRFSAPSPGRFGSVRIRGIASGRVAPERLGVVGAAFAFPLGPRLRLEAGADAAWAWEERSGYRGRVLAGVSVGVSARGPWKTLLEASLGFPVATPGRRGPAVELLLLRPL